MRFFKPQVQIAKEPQFDAPPHYFAHVVTFCPNTRFRAGNVEISEAELQSKGIYHVTVKLVEDRDLPDMEFITPVVHTLALGEIPFPNGDGWIRVTVESDSGGTAGNARDTNPTPTTKTGGSTSQNTAEATPRMRPIDESL